MSNRYRQPKKSTYTGSPWAIDPSEINPFMVNPMAAAMLNPYMQTALSSYGGPAGQIFNRNFDYRRDYGGRNYQNQRSHNSYYGGSNSRTNSKRGGNYNQGRRDNNNRDGRNKRFANESADNRGKKFKPSELYDPEEPTREEDDYDDDLEDEDDAHGNSNESDEEKSSKFGANAPSQDWKKDRNSHYCTVCELDFAGSFLVHRRTKEHRKQRDKKFPRCRLCRKTFQGVKEFEEHGKSEEHRKKCESLQAFKEQQLIQAALSDSEDEETSLKRYIASQGQEKISDENTEPIGQFHVVPLKTFFCKLCQKFFSNYTDGREIHCQTPDHIQKLKDHKSAKEARAIERNNIRQAEKKEKLEKQQKDEADQKVKEEQKNGEEEQEGKSDQNSEEVKDKHCENKPEEGGDDQEVTGAEGEEAEEDACADNEGEEEHAENEAEDGGEEAGESEQAS